MSARRKLSTPLEGRPIQATGMRHGSFPGSGLGGGHWPLEQVAPAEVLENKIAFQAAEIEQLSGDNHRLAASHGTLRQELLAAQQEGQILKAHMRSIQTESDIQIRVLLDKIAKKEADIRAGEVVKKELQLAHKDAQSLLAARQELSVQIQLATQELQKARADVKSLSDLLAELDSLRKEHHRLRATFQYEKGLNIEQVEQMQAMEKDLIAMARELEKMHVEVLNAENRAHAPNLYAGGYGNPDSSYPSPMQGSAPYIGSYGRAHIQKGIGSTGEGMVAHGSDISAPAPTTSVAAVWGGAYDPALNPR